MVLELHTWGPAFGLPSFDAQCLATVAYFVQGVPPTEWRLVPSSDSSVSPTSMVLTQSPFCFEAYLDRPAARFESQLNMDIRLPQYHRIPTPALQGRVGP